MEKNLEYWKEWVRRNETAYREELDKMDRREALYRGEVREIAPLTEKDLRRDGSRRETAHLRNIVAENIESEVSSVIPQPKVTARRKEDEGRAKLLEDMLRNELDRLPMEDWEDGVPLVYALHSFHALEDTGTEWRVTFADSTRAYKTALTGSENKKGVLRLLIRCRLAGSMKVWIAYDGGEFEEAGEFGGEDGLAKTSKVVPLILRRCDFWQLRLTGVGDAVIYSIAVERYGGEWQQA